MVSPTLTSFEVLIEPKIKVYIMTSGSSKAECDAKVAKYAAWAPAISDMK